LGRDFKLDDISENTGIAKETHRQFFHQFMLFGSTVLYDKYVKMPLTKEELMPHLQHYAKKGLHGAVGSMDATHIASRRIPNSLRQLHTGYKLTLPARAYNATVNNNRQILNSTKGAPARWNDKSIVHYDEFYNKIKSHEIGNDIEFELYYYDTTSKKIMTQMYCGVWLLVDNGYHEISCTIPPFKETKYTDQYIWSEWMESTRKDVECIFGILKHRFLIFNSPIRFHGIKIIDRIWLTCCALHNVLLKYDDADIAKEGDNIGKNHLELPDPRTTEMKYPPTVNFVCDDDEDDCTYPNGCGVTIPIKKLRMKTFRNRLVRHFAICKVNGLVSWD
jgi:hypothetical protein